jgi:Leucine-rich repeat (LRR) protein
MKNLYKKLLLNGVLTVSLTATVTGSVHAMDVDETKEEQGQAVKEFVEALNGNSDTSSVHSMDTSPTCNKKEPVILNFVKALNFAQTLQNAALHTPSDTLTGAEQERVMNNFVKGLNFVEALKRANPHARDYLEKTSVAFDQAIIQTPSGPQFTIRNSTPQDEIITISPFVHDRKFHNLTKLDVREKTLKVLPKEIGELTHLKHMDFSLNKISVLPEEIKKLTNLKFMKCSYNEISTLPDWIGQLVNLEELDLQCNRLIAVPETIECLVNLNFLHLNNSIQQTVIYNDIKTLPAGITKLTKLLILDVRNNKLMSLSPPQLCDLLKACKSVNLRLNDTPLERILTVCSRHSDEFTGNDSKKHTRSLIVVYKLFYWAKHLPLAPDLQKTIANIVLNNKILKRRALEKSYIRNNLYSSAFPAEFLEQLKHLKQIELEKSYARSLYCDIFPAEFLEKLIKEDKL